MAGAKKKTNTALVNTDELRNMTPTQVGDLFDQHIKILEKLSKKIKEVHERCKKAEEEVEYARDVDYKGFFKNNYSKAIDYLQDACVALMESQISIQEALNIFFQYQRITTNMINALLFACSNNLESMKVLQDRIDSYIKKQNRRNDIMDQILPSLLDLQARLQQDSQKLQMISDMKKQMQEQADYLKLNTGAKTQKTGNSIKGSTDIKSIIEKAITENDKITRAQISEKTGISVKELTQLLKEMDYIKYVGRGKNGRWVITNTVR